MDLLEPILALLGLKAGSRLDRLPVHHRATNNHIHSHSYKQCTPVVPKLGGLQLQQRGVQQSHTKLLAWMILQNVTLCSVRSSSSSPTGRWMEVPWQPLWIAAIQGNKSGHSRSTHLPFTYRVYSGAWLLVDRLNLHTAHQVAGSRTRKWPKIWQNFKI